VYNTTADYIPVDLSKESNLETYVREVKKLYPHGVDILVNNAGNSSINTAFNKRLAYRFNLSQNVFVNHHHPHH